jgi:hypothetical protein
MQSKGIDQEVPEYYFDQAVFKYTLPEFAASYVGSISGTGYKIDRERTSRVEPPSTHLHCGTDENRQVIKKKGRVHFTSPPLG